MIEPRPGGRGLSHAFLAAIATCRWDEHNDFSGEAINEITLRDHRRPNVRAVGEVGSLSVDVALPRVLGWIRLYDGGRLDEVSRGEEMIRSADQPTLSTTASRERRRTWPN